MNETALAVVEVVEVTELDHLASQINAEHRAFETALRAAVYHAYNAGRLLKEAKDACIHGSWLDWIKQNCEFAERTAQDYMRFAEWMDEDPANPLRVADLSYRQVLALIASDRRASHALINQSGGNEWHTPLEYIEAAREVMGAIDLDPASNPEANKRVKAARIFTIADDGLSQPWPGRVFLNPPYGWEEGEGSNQARWSARLIEQYRAGITEQAICLVNAVPGEKWFQRLWDFRLCFTDHRIRFEAAGEARHQPTHSSCFVYLGPNEARFEDVFERFGRVAEWRRRRLMEGAA
jgi:hypothetical protein